MEEKLEIKDQEDFMSDKYLDEYFEFLESEVLNDF